jgi:hypothetical protein
VFTLGFVASDVPAVVLEPDDAAVLVQHLSERFEPDRLGLPDLLGRLRDGARDAQEVTVDERQAEELFMALGAAADDGELSPRLAQLLSSVERYLAPG